MNRPAVAIEWRRYIAGPDKGKLIVWARIIEGVNLGCILEGPNKRNLWGSIEEMEAFCAKYGWPVKKVREELPGGRFRPGRPANYTLCREKVEGRDGLPETYQTFVVKRDGFVIGKLSYDRGRWKNAGGPAWCGELFPVLGSLESGAVVHSKNKDRVLDWFKGGPAPA